MQGDLWIASSYTPTSGGCLPTVGTATLEGDVAGQTPGDAVAAGDLDGDGVDDLLVTLSWLSEVLGFPGAE